MSPGPTFDWVWPFFRGAEAAYWQVLVFGPSRFTQFAHGWDRSHFLQMIC